ncbi:hypothetical protein CI15_29935 [Paraburkholderia monticola]|uniref:Uncharacterized protein n=1 Tax=Paraburkholderia monticola TaxID=1399968 RepID=A0A149PE35_9BURK|nr:hypothetical protein [Paraburkholderia monticola]KXU83315.1 hypothetical protein CI15_29935 [Paraburkholderia monticola]
MQQLPEDDDDGVAIAVPMDPYAQLFERYVRDMRDAREDALEWWQQLANRELAITGDAATVECNLKQRWPCGPVSFPRVVAVFRQYFLECEALEPPVATLGKEPCSESDWGVEDDNTNESLPSEPRQLLIEHLISADEELGRFMRFFVFIPIGHDASGRVV